MDLKSLLRLLSPAQILTVVDSPQKMISLWVGAVSAGKTIASLIAFLLALRTVGPVGDVVIIGKTLNTIERNVIGQLQNRSLFGAVAKSVVHTRGSSVAIILGRRVELIGANNAAAEERIRGGTFALVYVDEATLLPKEFWNMLVTRLRVAGARLIATTNPASRNHWLRKEWILRGAEVDMVTFHMTMYDNPLYFEGGAEGPSYIARMERTYTGVFYDRFILGKWTTAEGAIYSDWNEHNRINWADMPDLSQVIGVGIDAGSTHPTVAIMLGLTAERAVDERGRVVPRPRLVLMDELVIEGKNGDSYSPSVQAAMYRDWLKTRHVPETVLFTPPRYTVVDTAAKWFRDELGRPAGGSPGIPTTAANKDVLAGIGTVSSLISQNLLVSTERCEKWLSEVTEYRWDPKAQEKGEDEPVKENDDSSDATRYITHTTRALWLPRMREAYKTLGLAA